METTGQKRVHKEVLVDFLRFVKNHKVPGTQVTTEDWNKAYEVFWTINAMETAQWKLDNLTVGEYDGSGVTDEALEDYRDLYFGEPE